MRDLAFFVLVAVVYGMFALDRAPAPALVPAPDRTAPAVEFLPRMSMLPAVTRRVHSVSAVVRPDGSLLAVCFGGDREGARDAQLYLWEWQPPVGPWSAPRSILDRAQAQTELRRRVKTIGNPLLFADADDNLQLYFVTVERGGWAGSTINHKVSRDGGATWSRARRLVTAPFLNLGTLVRNAPLRYDDGTFGLPVSNEFVGKFGELLRVDAAGRIRARSRITWGDEHFQPAVVALDADRAVAFLRDSSDAHQLLRSESTDAGRSWSAGGKPGLTNHHNAVAALRLAGGRLLLAYNPLDGRRELALAVSDDAGRSWRTVKVVDRGATEFQGRAREYSYPWLVQAPDGTIHLLYTWNRITIKHLAFHPGWLE